MIDVLIGALLALIMFSIGLGLQRADFRQLVAAPGVVLLGLCLQLMWLPLLAFGVASALKLPAAFAVGTVVLAACPGGLTSNFISYLLRARTSLAVSLTICNTTLSLLTIPLLVNLGLRAFGGAGSAVRLPFMDTAGRLFLVVLVPVFLGMLFRARARVRAEKIGAGLRYVNVGLLALLFAIKLFAPTEAGGSPLSLTDIRTILPASLLINAGALLGGYCFGRLAGFGRNTQLTLGVEVGIQNTSLAFLITGTLLGDQEMLKPALVYAMFTFFTALGYGVWLKPGSLRRALRG